MKHILPRLRALIVTTYVTCAIGLPSGYAFIMIA